MKNQVQNQQKTAKNAKFVTIILKIRKTEKLGKFNGKLVENSNRFDCALALKDFASALFKSQRLNERRRRVQAFHALAMFVCMEWKRRGNSDQRNDATIGTAQWKRNCGACESSSPLLRTIQLGEKKCCNRF